MTSLLVSNVISFGIYPPRVLPPHTDTDRVDGADWDAEREINTVPDAEWVAGPVDNGCGVGTRQRPGDPNRSWWPQEEPCGLFTTDYCRYSEVDRV